MHTELPFFTAAEFKTKARAGSLPKDFALRKQFIAEVKIDDTAARSLEFTISTGSVDRDSDRIAVDGWQLENYRRNPVVLWAHDYRELPIGRSTKVWTEGGRLKSVAEFADADLSPFADQVYRFYRRGFMTAVSVGFRPKKWAFSDDKDRKYGVDFQQQELLEYSAVPVPANADALVERGGSGGGSVPVADARALIEGMRRSLGLPMDPGRAMIADLRRVMLGR